MEFGAITIEYFSREVILPVPDVFFCTLEKTWSSFQNYLMVGFCIQFFTNTLTPGMYHMQSLF